MADEKVFYHFYDLDHAPPTFNAVVQIVSAEIARAETTDCDHTHTIFVPGLNDGFNWTNEYGVDIKRWRLMSILLPALSLYKTNTSHTLLRTRENASELVDAAGTYKFPVDYSVDVSSDCAQINTPTLNSYLGYGPKSIAAPKRAIELTKQLVNRVCPGQKFITITARGSAHLLQRNSSPETLINIAKYMQQQGYFVFFVPDYDLALQVSDNFIPGAYVAREISLSLPFRSALYELASLNIGDGGTAALSYFNSKCNYIINNLNWPHKSRDIPKSLRQQGMALGKGVNYHNTFARWVWPFDDAQATIDACEEFVAYSQGRSVDVNKYKMSFDEVLLCLSESLGADAVSVIKSKYSNRQNGPLFINRQFKWEDKRNMSYVIKSADSSNNDFSVF
ncbi:MAG: hypothetical protein RIC29_13955 [Rhodospirillaceae bacterium]